MNGKYDIIHDLFFKLQEGGRKGHEHKLFKKSLDSIENFVSTFSNRIRPLWINKIIPYINDCVNINTFKNIYRPKWIESEVTQLSCISVMATSCAYLRQRCLPNVVGIGEFSERFDLFRLIDIMTLVAWFSHCQVTSISHSYFFPPVAKSSSFYSPTARSIIEFLSQIVPDFIVPM